MKIHIWNGARLLSNGNDNDDYDDDDHDDPTEIQYSNKEIMSTAHWASPREHGQFQWAILIEYFTVAFNYNLAFFIHKFRRKSPSN